MAKNDPGSTNDGMTRKQRRAAERAARKDSSSSSASASPSKTGPSMLMISLGAIAIGVIAVAALMLLSGGLGGDDSATVAMPDHQAPAQDLRVGRSLGDPDAPVKIEAFEDPQCPACGLFTERIEPLVVDAARDGDVFFTYKDFAFLGQESFDAAAAMRVAEAMDGKFWDYHDIVFFNQDGENRGAFSIERLADMAEAVGLDRAEFLTQMEDPQYVEAVEAENAEGRDRGVNSTPSLFVNGELIRGVPSWDDLSALIDAGVAAAASGVVESPAAETTAPESPAAETTVPESPAAETQG